LCFPSALKLAQQDPSAAADTTADAAPTSKPTSKPSAAAGGGAASSSEPPFSALDGLWQLLRQAPSLLSSQPKLLAAVLRALATLWECQGSAHGAVELLRGQKDFWTAIKVSRGAVTGAFYQHVFYVDYCVLRSPAHGSVQFVTIFNGSQPELCVAAVLRALATLWECQRFAHGAVELLRGRKDFWAAIKVSGVQ
jgi:hypothetical protein